MVVTLTAELITSLIISVVSLKQVAVLTVALQKVTDEKVVGMDLIKHVSSGVIVVQIKMKMEMVGMIWRNRC